MERDNKKTDSFIKELTKMSREEITKYILEKGKEPKLMRAFSYIRSDN